MRRWIFCLLIIATTFAMSVAPSTARAATPESDCRVTTAAENEATARLWFTEGYNAGNVDILNEIMAPDALYHAATFADSRGPAETEAIMQAVLVGFPDIQYSIDTAVTEGDIVVLGWSAVGSNTGEFHGHPPTNVRDTWVGVNVFRFECGRIAEAWAVIDQVNGIPIPPAAPATPTP
jgi:predicted ester cyclase